MYVIIGVKIYMVDLFACLIHSYQLRSYFKRNRNRKEEEKIPQTGDYLTSQSVKIIPPMPLHFTPAL